MMQSWARNLILGAVIANSAAGLANATDAPGVEHDPQPLNVPTQIDRTSGPLSPYLPPDYHGPLRWGIGIDPSRQRALNLTAAIVLAPACGLAVAVAAGSKSQVKGAIAGVVSAGLIGGAFLCVPPQADCEICVPTTVTGVFEKSDPYYTGTKVGQVRISSGPFFNQEVKIRDSDMLLEVRGIRTPLTHGQQIMAHFGIKDGRIVSWEIRQD